MDIDISKLSKRELDNLLAQVQTRLDDFGRSDFEARAKAIIEDINRLAQDYPSSCIYVDDDDDEKIDFLYHSPEAFSYSY